MRKLRILVLPNDPLSIYIKQGNLEQFIERYKYYADNLGEIYIINFDDVQIDYDYPNIKIITKQIHRNKIMRFIHQIYSLFKLVRELKPDLIRTMDGGNFIRGTIAGVVGKLTNTPTVVSIHGYHSEFATSFNYKWYHNLAASILEKISGTMNDMFFVVDPTYISKLKWKNMHYIPNYIDTNIFHPIKMKKRWVGIYVGALKPVKGIKYLLESIRLVRKKIPSARFAIAGHGPLINEVKNAEGVDYLGAIPYKELPKYYNQSHMFVTATLWESFCMPVVEAQACGIPIVASDLFPFYNNTIPGTTSFLVEAKNTKKLSEMIIKVYKKKIDKTQVRSFILHNFDKKNVLMKEVNLILKMLKVI